MAPTSNHGTLLASPLNDMANQTPNEPEGQDPHRWLSQSGALTPLLVIFSVTILGVTAMILESEPFVPPHGAAADRAFGPGDFRERLKALEVDLPPAEAEQEAFPVPRPPFSEGAFPCTECHDPDTADPERRELELAHDDIILSHDEENRWCLDCHDLENRDSLRLASGALVPFEESYRLCGQCHGTQLRDWKSGIHGKRTGYWNGPRRYLLCVHCHNPHSPKFMELVPFPPPVRPQFLRTEDAPDTEHSARPQPGPPTAHTEETHG